jgi:hypothetical protein
MAVGVLYIEQIRGLQPEMMNKKKSCSSGWFAYLSYNEVGQTREEM